MRRRRVRKDNRPGQNLDSFLDILTNTVGVLMFIGLFVSLLAVEAGTIIRTPLKSNTNKIGHFFEVRNEEVFYLSDPQIDAKIERLFSSLPVCSRPNFSESVPSYLYDLYLQEGAKYQQCQAERYEQLKNFRVDTGYYLVSFINGEGLQYEPIPNADGDDKKDLRQADSQFKNTLQNLDSDVHYVAFIVRPDSFSTFRRAREIAWNQGFDVGWEPFDQSSVLVFGSGGRQIGVQ